MPSFSIREFINLNQDIYNNILLNILTNLLLQVPVKIKEDRTLTNNFLNVWPTVGWKRWWPSQCFDVNDLLFIELAEKYYLYNTVDDKIKYDVTIKEFKGINKWQGSVMSSIPSEQEFNCVLGIEECIWYTFRLF